ncbi:MAG: hypothetical protein ONB37_19365 [candidate division KSB1 bacterium]|nr:hypothetical protein [candidate division KSB1 bacterium]
MKKTLFLLIELLTFSSILSAQIIQRTTADSILGHAKQRDASGKLLAWYQPNIPGAGYVKVAQLASEFIKNAPIYEPLKLPMYFITCCFYQDEQGKFIPEDWMHNPACLWAGLVQGLALNYFPFSGDKAYIDIVRNMLDYQLQHGTTPANWPWPNVPFASADPFVTEYQGASRWEHEGMRGDGLHGIEPDKVGELGYAYLKFYQVTLEERFLKAAIHCAEALAKHVRDLRPDPTPFAPTKTEKSPWPFRVNARTNVVISEYCSNVIGPISLFDELLRTKERIGLSSEQIAAFQRVRDLAWSWLYSINGPMKTFIWNAYFEDIPNDPDRSNRNQITPLETARYLIKNPQLDPNIDRTVPLLIHWVASVFATEGMDAIREQTWCYEPMGSHTSRYASLCALWYERTGEPWYRDQAERFFNLATYMCQKDGYVSVGPNWPGAWWSDGYGDYIRHFMEGIAAVPEWAPRSENHLLKSTSVIQSIDYGVLEIFYQTYDDQSIETLRLLTKPRSVLINSKPISQREKLDAEGWTWEKLARGGVLRVKHSSGNKIKIQF